MASTAVSFEAGELSLDDLRRIARQPGAVELAGDWRARVAAAAATVADMVHRDEPVYGVNTGFGLLARTRIEPGKLGELQVRLVRSHMAGVGEHLGDQTVRLVLALKANALARGYSGVRVELVELLLAMLERGLTPCVPSQGSVGGQFPRRAGGHGGRPDRRRAGRGRRPVGTPHRPPRRSQYERITGFPGPRSGA